MGSASSVLPGRDTRTRDIATKPENEGRLQLGYIDGLRGFAALYIVIHHVLAAMTLPQPHSLILRFFEHGTEVVGIFLTISGFCLALPLARRGRWTLDSQRFLKRRAWRILPPYYAACLLALPFALLQGRFGHPLSVKAIWSHLVLLQNWVPGQMYTLDGPLWSVALECQIYLVFPLIVALRNKTGPFITLGLTVLLGLGSFKIFHGAGQISLFACFGVGIFFAEAGFRKTWQTWIPVVALVAACAAVFHTYAKWHTPLMLWSVFSGALMAALVHRKGSPARRLLEWKPLVTAGLFSYSIYLVHDIFVETVERYLTYHDPGFHRAPSVHGIVALSLAGLIAIPIAYVFHLYIELPFISAKRQETEHRVMASL